MNWRIGSSLDCFALLAMTLRYIRVIANEVKQSKSQIVVFYSTLFAGRSTRAVLKILVVHFTLPLRKSQSFQDFSTRIYERIFENHSSLIYFLYSTLFIVYRQWNALYSS